MSRYAFDDDNRTLIVSWGTGAGDTALVVGRVPADVRTEQALGLARALTRFSLTAWRTYTHPASSARTLNVNSEGWRRQGNRDAFDLVVDAVKSPNLPHRNGSIIQSYIPTEEAAHQVGRALHDIGDPTLTDCVVSEIERELNAVERAELGDLGDRARQAVELSRTSSSPAQIQAADGLLRGDPFGPRSLLTDVDPAAASVATAHWLQAAADVAADMSGLEPVEVVLEADNIEAIPHDTPTLVLELLAMGARPFDAVNVLINEALTVADGEMPDVDSVLARIRHIDELVEEHPNEPGLRESILEDLRVCALDPLRPAPDLLEDLLSGIYGCWLIYRDYVEVPERDDDLADDLADDLVAAQASAAARVEFIEAVREEAELNRDRVM